MSESINGSRVRGSARIELYGEMLHTPELHLFLGVEEISFCLVFLNLFDGVGSFRNVFELIPVALTVLDMDGIFFVIFGRFSLARVE